MKSFPFTSDGGDRKVYTKDFRALFSKYFTNGVFNGGFAVTPATGMKVNVSAGACNINGVFAYSDDNTEMPIETVSSETYFNIVLRLDDNKASRNVGLYVVKGTSTPPELTRNETVYELCIARIKVGANNQSITVSMIEDTRLKTDLCGIVANAVQVLDTDTYYQQLQAKLDEVIDIVDQALDGTLAGNLQNQINERIKITDIVDNLESTDTDKPLSANQGNKLAKDVTLWTGNVNGYSGSAVLTETPFNFKWLIFDALENSKHTYAIAPVIDGRLMSNAMAIDTYKMIFITSLAYKKESKTLNFEMAKWVDQQNNEMITIVGIYGRM